MFNLLFWPRHWLLVSWYPWQSQSCAGMFPGCIIPCTTILIKATNLEDSITRSSSRRVIVVSGKLRESEWAWCAILIDDHDKLLYIFPNWRVKKSLTVFSLKLKFQIKCWERWSFFASFMLNAAKKETFQGVVFQDAANRSYRLSRRIVVVGVFSIVVNE